MDEHTESHVRGVVIALLLDPRNDGLGFVTQAEAMFGSTAFDNHFNLVKTDALLQMLTEYANDEEPEWGPLKDFLGTIDEYVAMPVGSLLRRMIDTAKRVK